MHFPLKQKKIKPRSKQYQQRGQIKQITHIAKDRFEQLNIYELQISRYNDNLLFEELVKEIRNFNIQLEMWKQNKSEIQNIIVLYHLYHNLLTRLRDITSFANQSHSEHMICKIRSWFYFEKAKVRQQSKQIKAEIKPLRNEHKIQPYQFQYQHVKAELQPYQRMVRTNHHNFYPKDDLKSFKKKDIAVFTQKQQQLYNKKNKTAQSQLYKTKLSNYRKSLTSFTRETPFKETTEHFRNTGIQFSLESGQSVQVGQLKLQKSQEFIKKEENEQKSEQKSVQENKNQANIVNYQQQNKEKEDSEIAQDQKDDEHSSDLNQTRKNPKKIKKLFISDNDQIDIMVCRQVTLPSTFESKKKIHKIENSTVRSKFQDKQAKKYILNWAKNAGQFDKLQQKKNCLLKVGSLDKKQLKEILQSKQKESHLKYFDFSQKIQQKNSIGKSISEEKLRSTLKTWGKYVNCEQNSLNSEKSISKKKSLTSFKTNNQKRTSLPGIMQISVNKKSSTLNLREEVSNLKTTLSHKKVSIQQNIMHNAFDNHEASYPSVEIFPKKTLLGNPLFCKS